MGLAVGADLSHADLAVHGRRLLSALLLLTLFLLVVVFGGEAGFALMGLGVAAIGTWEFARLVDHSVGVSGVLALLSAVVLVGVTYVGGIEGFALVAVLLLLLQLSRVVWSSGDLGADLRRAALAFLGLLYVAGPLCFAVALRGMAGGERYILLVCGIVWVGDTGAFYMGSFLGHRPLAPRVSPRKTVEGSAGGLVASMAAAWVLGRGLGIPLPFLASLLLGAVIGGAGQIGDLIESVFKRAFQAKDTGRLIPGHGGMLDRIDSLLFAIPIFYLVVRLGWI
ncbi:MAG: phosphatidate cytidylyltransferase [Candidatus Methylomirabilales bacterium]